MPKYQLKKFMQLELIKRDEVSQELQASNGMEDTDSDHGREQMEEAGLGLILKELRVFRKDNSQQLKEIREEINKTNTRIEEAEKRIRHGRNSDTRDGRSGYVATEAADTPGCKADGLRRSLQKRERQNPQS